MPLWWRPSSAYSAFELHIGICIVLLASIASIWKSKSTNNRVYLMVCSALIAILWGGIHSLYAHDPLFFHLDASWGGPVLCGILCCSFASDLHQQFSVIALGAIMGEFLSAWLDAGSFTMRIGGLFWWDSVWAAVAAALLMTLLQRFGKRMFLKIGRASLKYRKN
ncbi:hypothetical protein [Paenibacillus sp. HB172176]|uniref:YphA family membrane protein n=1 Tax=Paenibacillus sp. HB172176 TaxID=2493690 RepID=UPI00143BFB1E|nr:hypothetical protein [Paenibacillus sp. HB172176]